MTDSPQTRWDREMVSRRDSWQAYVDRFTELHESDEDADGEARFIDALAERESLVLDAGCGAGRVGAALLARGHSVVGIDKDAGHIEIGRGRYPGLPLIAGDLLHLDAAVLQDAGLPAQYDIVALAGNVMVFLASGTEREILSRLTALLRPGGRLVAGFATDREYTVGQLDADATAVGLNLQHRFGSWQLAPYDGTGGWAVSVLART